LCVSAASADNRTPKHNVNEILNSSAGMPARFKFRNCTIPTSGIGPWRFELSELRESPFVRGFAGSCACNIAFSAFPGVTWLFLRRSRAAMLGSVCTPLGTMQSLLGHSTPEITREIYLHAIPEEQHRAVESVERLVFGPKWTQVQPPAQTAPARWN